MKLNTVAKSVMAFVVAGLGSLQVALVDGAVSPQEWVIVASSAVAALAFVWGVPNASTAKTETKVEPTE